jgi:hypothetical protein
MTTKPFAAVRGATLWIPGTGPAHDQGRGHLFIILTNPCPDGMVLMVPVCSVGTKYDNTCILGKGDHNFLTHKSFLAYYRLGTSSAAALVEQVKKTVFVDKGMLNERVFALVCNGVTTSRDAPPKHKRYFEKHTAAVAHPDKKATPAAPPTKK